MDEDDALAKMRAQRLQQLQGQYGGDPHKQQQQQEQKQRQEEMKLSILSQIMDQNARARLNSIALVKPDKARQIEAMLVQMAQKGQIADKMTDSQLVSLLEQVGAGSKQSTKVKFERRRVMDSDSDSD